MKPEEAIRKIRKIKYYFGTDEDQKDIEHNRALNLAIQALEKQELTERAMSAFIGQAGENDGYLGCYMVHRQNHQHCQTGDTVESLDELIEWYKENFPEEIDWSEE